MLAGRLAGRARWLKVGMTLYYAEGPQIVRELKERGFKVFVDLKLHDIPHQVRGAAASVVAAGADMLTVHGAGGLAMMQAAAEGVEAAWECREASGASSRHLGALRHSDGIPAQRPGPALSPGDIPGHDDNGHVGLARMHDLRPSVLAITVLTSMDSQALSQVGVARSVSDQVETLALLARQAGLDGVVASPQEAAILRRLLGERAIIVTPGVRPAGAAVDDQSRIATPERAVTDGASHLVIGRPITAAADPVVAFDAILDEIGSRV